MNEAIECVFRLDGATENNVSVARQALNISGFSLVASNSLVIFLLDDEFNCFDRDNIEAGLRCERVNDGTIIMNGYYSNDVESIPISICIPSGGKGVELNYFVDGRTMIKDFHLFFDFVELFSEYFDVRSGMVGGESSNLIDIETIDASRFLEVKKFRDAPYLERFTGFILENQNAG